MKKIDDTKCWISHTLPVGMRNGAATVEKSLAISFIFSLLNVYTFLFFLNLHTLFSLYLFFKFIGGDNC